MPDSACPICRGSGWRIEERNGISGAERCPCTAGDIQRQTLQFSGLPALYQNASLDNFDATGEWRANEAVGIPVDATGQLADGTPVNGPIALRQALLKHPEQFVRTMTEKLLTYGLGRGLEHYDMAVVRAIANDAARENYRFSSLIAGIVRSVPFQMKKVSGSELPVSSAARR